VRNQPSTNWTRAAASRLGGPRPAPRGWSRSAAALALAWLALAPPGVYAETLVLSGASVNAQTDYRVVHWTTTDGLPQNSVTDLLILPNGELWLSTFGGLVRFDGHGFEVLDIAADEGLVSNRIVSLGAPVGSSFLFLTQEGYLGRVAEGRAAALAPPPDSPAEALEMLADPSGRLFCKWADGRIWYTDDRRSWRILLEDAKGAHGTTQDLAEDGSGETWAVWGRELLQITGGRPGAAVVLSEREVTASPRLGGGLWLGLEGGIDRWVDGRRDRLRIRPALEGKVGVIEQAEEGTLWAATGVALWRLERQGDGSWRSTPLPLRPPGGLRVRVLHVDAAGSLWIGTTGNGLYRLNPVPVRRFAAESGLQEVSAVAGDGNGGAFVTTGCRQLFHIDGAGGVATIPFHPTGAGERLPCGISLAPGPPGGAWMRLGRTLYRLRREPLGIHTVSEVAPMDEGPVVPRADGSMWIVSRDGSVQLVSPEGALVRGFRLPAPLVSAAPGPDGSMWIGGEGVVLRVGQGSIHRFGPEEEMPRGLVRDVLAEPDGTTWIGSYGGGLGRLRGGRVARLTAAEGLPDNSISRILDDGRGRLWISTNRGVAVVAKSELEAVADGRARRFAPVVFAEDRGVTEANFGRPAGFAGADGRLWFGTIDGVARVEAADFPFNPTPPVVRVVEVRADGRALPLGSTVRVPPLTVRLRVTVATHAPLYPEQLRFRYRVEGVDPGWVEAGAQRTLDWTPPGPGRHVVLVEARNEDGVWSAAPTSVELDLQAAWWQTRTFWTAVFVALALAGALEVRRQIRRVERRHAAEMRALEEQREAEARTASLRAQLEHVSRAALAGELAASLTHEVRQPIGAIVNNAEAGRRNLGQYLQRPADLEQVLEDIVADGRRASEVVQGLRGFLTPVNAAEEALDLSEVVREMLPLVRRELEENGVEIVLELADDLPRVDGLPVQVGQVVVNLMMNACEALATKEGERRIGVATAARDGRVELVVWDNGPGLSPQVGARVFEPFVTTKPGGLGVGLAICRSIAERHGGHLRAYSPAGGGARLTLTLPAQDAGELHP